MYKGLKEGDGLTWENQDERIARLESKYTMVNSPLSEEAFGLNETDLMLITDPAKMGQTSQNLYEILGEQQERFREDHHDMDVTINQVDEIAAYYGELSIQSEKNIEKYALAYRDEIARLYREKAREGVLGVNLNPFGSEFNLVDSKGNLKFSPTGLLSLEEELKLYNRYERKVKKEKSNLEKLVKNEDSFNKRENSLKKIKTYVLDTPQNKFVKETASKLCYVIAHYSYGKSMNKESRDFGSFYYDELSKGNIGSVSSKTGKANAYYGTGGGVWGKKYGLNDRKVLNFRNRTQRADFLKRNKTGKALIYKDTTKNGNPNHWTVIEQVKDKNGNSVWKDNDHNRNFKRNRWNPKKVDWNSVYVIKQESMQRKEGD